MPKEQTLEDARQSLTAHVAAKGAEIRAKYGPSIGWSQLKSILADPDCVRYPCELVFDAAPLLPDEVAFRSGAEIRAKYGPSIGWSQLKSILADPDCVRYPCELVFDAAPLLPDEVAFPVPKGERPEDGFRLCVHPYFSVDPARVPLLAF